VTGRIGRINRNFMINRIYMIDRNYMITGDWRCGTDGCARRVPDATMSV